MPSRISNQWVIITGASSGFGAAAALAFAREGCRLLLGARRLPRLETGAGQGRQAGAPAALFHSLDVPSTRSVESFATWVRAQTPVVHLLINNAGGARGLDPVATGRDEDWEFMLQTNVLGVLRMTRAILPLMKETPGSYILNVGSIASRQPYEGGAAYCGAKAAALQITRSLRLELCGTGVRVGTIDPGMAETEFSLGYGLCEVQAPGGRHDGVSRKDQPVSVLHGNRKLSSIRRHGIQLVFPARPSVRNLEDSPQSHRGHREVFRLSGGTERRK